MILLLIVIIFVAYYYFFIYCKTYNEIIDSVTEMTISDILYLIFCYTPDKYKLHIKKSPIEGRGLFAGEFIPKDTILLFRNKRTKNINSKETYINDGDFNYPKTFAKKELFEIFSKYENSDKSNTEIVSCPIYPDLHFVRTKRDIMKGEELTKKYGMMRWCFFIGIQFVTGLKFSERNTFKPHKHKLSQEDKIKYNNLRYVAKSLYGIDLSYSTT